jgi:hypothetical protein
MEERIKVAEAATKIVCTVVVVFTFCWMLLTLTRKEIPKENEDTVNLMIGSLGGLVLAIVSYWYGSSEGSKRSAERLAKMTDTAFPSGGEITQTTKTVVQKEAEKQDIMN